jgi:threonine dehydrogenase-like Zn-dependent dehydrogenase
MQGLWLSKGSWAFKPDLLDPVIGLDESLVAVEAAGICGTDLELARGYYDFNGIPGHEFIGRVVSGAHRHCAERVVIGIHQRAGAFAQFLSVPNNNLITVNEDLSDGLAVLAEPVAAALEIIEQMPKPLPSRVLVVGAGRLGLLVAEVLASFDCEVAILVRSPERAAHLQNKRIQVVTSVESESFGWLVDCSGSSSGLATALRAAMPQAILVLKSTLTDAVGVDLSPIMVKELTVLGSRPQNRLGFLRCYSSRIRASCRVESTAAGRHRHRHRVRHSGKSHSALTLYWLARRAQFYSPVL